MRGSLALLHKAVIARPFPADTVAVVLRHFGKILGPERKDDRLADLVPDWIRFVGRSLEVHVVERIGRGKKRERKRNERGGK